MKRIVACALGMVLMWSSDMAARPDVPFGFPGETIQIAGVAPGAYSVRHITHDSWRTSIALEVFEAGELTLPDSPGLYTSQDMQFIVLHSPTAIREGYIQSQLPRHSKKLLNNEPFHIVAMGDSVSYTGQYAAMVGAYLARMTGNTQITVTVKAYPGRSIDATVRTFATDITPLNADMGLLMYGLNDHGAHASVYAFEEQIKWVHQQFSGDLVLCTPTPHIDPGEENNLDVVMRITGYGHRVKQIGKSLGIPVIDLFDALWPKRAMSLEDAIRMMETLYPLHYQKPGTTLKQATKHVGQWPKGDRIHPNALGHMMMAKRVSDSLVAPLTRSKRLTLTGESQWENDQVVSTIHVTCHPSQPFEGKLMLVQRSELPTLPVHAADREWALSLGPNESTTLKITWPTLKGAASLRTYPANIAFARGTQGAPILTAMVVGKHMSSVQTVAVPLQTTGLVRGRHLVSGEALDVLLDDNSKEHLTWPSQPVGRIPLSFSRGGEPVVGELAYVRAVRIMPEGTHRKLIIDGHLDEWGDHPWSVLGEACQARWVHGPQDFRSSPEAFYIKWGIRETDTGLVFGMKVADQQAAPVGQRFTIYVDARETSQLGTVGPYAWVSGLVKAGGTLDLRRGETSPKPPYVKPLNGKWQLTDAEFTAEWFMPFEVFNVPGLGKEGDLGLSWMWEHKNEKGGRTRLQWSEDGHPWNTRWYGLARRDNGKPMPYVVRIK